MVKIPFTADAWQTFRCNLGAVEHTFVANYNDRNGVWSFDLYRSNPETLLVAGIPILIGCDILAPYALGLGVMFATDLAATTANQVLDTVGTIGPISQPIDAGPDDLGTRVIVVFIPAAELVP